MEEQELENKTLKLRRKLYTTMQEFWVENINISQRDIFLINSLVMSSLIAQITFMIFKKEEVKELQEKRNEYINELCNLSKEQLKHGTELFNKDIQ